MVNAVVLGGGGVDARLAGFYDGPTKGLAPLAGRTSLDWVLDCLCDTEGVGRIALSGPAELGDLPIAQRADLFVPDTGSVVDKVLHAADAFADGLKILMIGCDTPLATPQALGTVIGACPEDCAVFHPVVPYETARAYCSAHLWTPLKLRGGTIVTTNVFLVGSQWVVQRRELAKEIEGLRQHKWRLARRFGVGFLVRFAMGRLTLAQCEEHFSKLLGAPVRGFLCELPELALDLDRPDDAGLIEERLRAGAGAALTSG